MPSSRRRSFAVVLAVSLVLAGCAGSDGPRGTTATTDTTSVTTDATTEPVTTTSAETTTSTTRATLTDREPPYRLRVYAYGDVWPVRVTVWKGSFPDGEPVFNRTYEDGLSGLYGVDSVFEERVSYYAVVRANGTVVFNRTIYASYGYRVEVTPNGTDVGRVVV